MSASTPNFSRFLAQEPCAAESRDAHLVEDVLDAVREHLDMDVAFISRQIGSTHRIFTHVSAKGFAPIHPGLENANDNSVCWQVIQGNLPEAIADTSEYEASACLPIVEELDLRSHFSIPLKRKDGSVHGSFCCFSHCPRPEITERDMQVMRAFAALVNDHIELSIESDERQNASREALQALLKSRELEIWHQPIFDLDRQCEVGAECLARFPDRVLRGPEQWFAEAASIGMGLELELYTVAQALGTSRRMAAGEYISINISPTTLVSGRLWDLLPPNGRDRIVIEITEHEHISDYSNAACAIDLLKQRARIAIDDVGAGFAGLRHIVDLRPDILKIDRQLTSEIDADPARRALVTALIHYAGEIGAQLIAEGIETQEELETLRDLGVHFGQGFLLGKPQPRQPTAGTMKSSEAKHATA